MVVAVVLVMTDPRNALLARLAKYRMIGTTSVFRAL
jgi:hypothetical protein